MIRSTMKLAGMLSLALMASGAGAQVIGKWTAGFAQGTSEYSVKTGPKTEFTIFCGDGGPFGKTGIRMAIAGRGPKPGSTAMATVDKSQFQLIVDADGDIDTSCNSCADNFYGLWKALRSGKTFVVRFADGRTARFPLTGAAKALPREQCTADAEK